ncbi:hypothetical protein BVI2075_230192 [Burkholderia vietnamiensis]|nr:hypothetical protein BVI2075_230192 [Burkholderia vietnamiensis]CAG9234081.1 hypothetical protein BVI1335_940013 [Burkholderia vietnamiensis]
MWTDVPNLLSFSSLCRSGPRHSLERLPH